MTSWEIGSARDALVAAGLDPEDVARTVRLALEEDLRYGPDITTAAVAAPEARAVADVVARKPGVVAGLPVAAAVLDAVGIRSDGASGNRATEAAAVLDAVGVRSNGASGNRAAEAAAVLDAVGVTSEGGASGNRATEHDAMASGQAPNGVTSADVAPSDRATGRAEKSDGPTRGGVAPGDGMALGDAATCYGAIGDGWTAVRKDGEMVAAGDVLATVRAPLRELLGAERTLLNFLTHLSGIATATRAWVDAVEGTGASVRDTRKTIPGLRTLEKYAVRCGGGLNHRMGLGDAALIKDNHVAAAGGVVAAFRAVRDAAPDVTIEVECDTLAQVWDALRAGATLILLDNMSVPEMSAAVRLAREYPLARLEASGGLRLENARQVAETGVHYLSVGALTHSSPALDIALDIVQ